MEAEMNMMASTTFCNECGASNPSQATHCFACNNTLQTLTFAPLPHVQAASKDATVQSSGANGPLSSSYLLHSRYSIVSQVGTGGFGAVYKAKDTLFSHRLVAIKEMNQDGLSSGELTEATVAFEHEALLLSNLTHPNLPRIHDHFSEHGRSYVVMDYIAGDTLEDYLDTVLQRLPLEMVLEIGIQLSTVLDYLHNHQPPIIFRDVKPTNIMRTVDNHVYLIDFGIARHFKPGKAKDTIPLGSKGYAAPEQYGKAQTTPQTDIYGLGATLHELLTGDDPSLSLFRFKPVKTNNRKEISITSQLNSLLEQMLEMEMSKRPANMTVVKQELQSIFAQQLALSQGKASGKSPKPIRRRRFLIGLASMVGTFALTTYFVQNPNLLDLLFTHPLTGTTPVLPPAHLVPEEATMVNQSLYTYRNHKGAVTAVAWSPDGQHIASSSTLDRTVHIWDAYIEKLAFLSQTQEDLTSFDISPQRVDVLAWSPDSIQTAAALSNDSVVTLNLKNGNRLLFTFSNTGNSNALAWSPDGSKIAAISENTTVKVLSAITGKFLFTFNGHMQTVLALAWSPDGKYIVSGEVDGTVRVWNATTGQTFLTYSRHSAAVYAVSWSPDSKLIASGGADGTVQVWDAATGRTLFIYRGHRGIVNTVAWQRGSFLSTWNNAYIASGGADTTVQVWSFGMIGDTKGMLAMALQGEYVMYRGHSGPVTSVTWAPDGQHIASGSEDGTVQVWQAM
jgi:eukaryotic-like serine/threonine-protein kinase